MTKKVVEEKIENNGGTGLPRRKFLKITGTIIAGVGISSGICQFAACRASYADNKGKIDTAHDPVDPPPRSSLDLPPSDGYILVDIKKCQGCMTCMLACSMAHEGKENMSLSRIQVVENPFGLFPEDILLDQCRQCLSPGCLKACPTGALFVDSKHGNVRRVDVQKCIGCKSCIESCPYLPGRMIWNFEKNCSQKCDLCVDTPYWDEKGGPGGKQACVAFCPLGAIHFTEEIPKQKGDIGYKVNLRDAAWAKRGYPID